MSIFLLSLACRALYTIWLIFCFVFVGMYFYAVSSRLTYPYPLEWLEPVTPDIVSRILEGLPIYCEPTYMYVSSMKTQLYYYVVALFGTGLLAGRIVSILSILGVCLVIWEFVRRETKTYSWAFFGAALFIAMYNISGGWYDIARVDSLFLLFTVVAAFLVRFSRGPAGAITAGIFFALAFFTKQAALLIATPILLLSTFTSPRQAIVASATFAALVICGLVTLHFSTNGWSTFFLMEVPLHVEIEWSWIPSFWRFDIFPLLFPALLTSVGILLKTWSSDRAKALFYTGFLCGSLLCGFLGRLHVGGAFNVLMPLYAVFSIMMPLGLQSVLQTPNDREVLRRASCIGVYLVALLQFTLLSYNPRRFIPSSAEKERSDQILAYLRSFDGSILVMSDRHFAKLLGKSSIGLEFFIG